MTVEATIQSLLDESRKMKELSEANEVVPTKGTPEPSNAKNNVDDEPEAKGGTSKKPNEATKGAVAPESAEQLKKVAEETEETFDMSQDVEALFNGEEGLTEEFRQKAETIFEAAVTSRIKEEVARIEEAFEERLEKALSEQVEGLVEHVDGYLNLMVKQWMENNEVALESGLKTEILESFVGGLKNVFETHYVEMPEEKFDVLAAMEENIESLTAKLDEAISTNVKLNAELSETFRIKAIQEACEGLSDIDSERMKTLAEEISFDNSDEFASKLQTIRENYFSKKSVKENAPVGVLLEDTNIQESVHVPAEMNAYVKTISNLSR